MRRILFAILGLGILSYIVLYLYIYSSQEHRFSSSTLEKDYKFEFKSEFEELNIQSKNDGRLNCLLFKSDNSRGVICFLKGNGGTMKNWGHLAPMFLTHNLDVLIADYRQHGKSTGEITQDNFYSDGQSIYDFLKTRYSENEITIIGYSLGTTIASHLSTTNRPKQTILIDPKTDFSAKIFDQIFFAFPSVNRFQFATEEDVRADSTPISIIVGTQSGLHRDSKKLKSVLKKNGHYYEINGANHKTILGHPELKRLFAELL